MQNTLKNNIRQGMLRSYFYGLRAKQAPRVKLLKAVLGTNLVLLLLIRVQYTTQYLSANGKENDTDVIAIMFKFIFFKVPRTSGPTKDTVTKSMSTPKTNG